MPHSPPVAALTPTPMDRLAIHLASLGNGRPVEGLTIADAHGGLWGLTHGPGFWPASLPGLQEAPRGRLGAYHAWMEEHRRRRLYGPKAGHDQIQQALVDCHLELTARNLRRLTPLFAPFWREFPSAAAAVGDKAVAWGLLFATIRQRGPAFALASAPKDLVPRASYQLTASDTWADVLSVHWGLEDLLDDAAGALALRPLPGAERRLPGGLRSRAFLAQYPALVDAAREQPAASAWLRAIDALIVQSPLTRLVYADLVRRHPLAPAGQAGGAAQITKAITDQVIADGDRLAPALGIDGSDAAPAWWRDLWFAHLARSLVAVVCSAPADHEHRELAQARYNAERDRLGPLAAQLALKNPSSELSRQAAAIQTCTDRMRLQPFHRLMDVLGMCLAPTRRAARVYLQTRFLDMLLRYQAMEERHRLRDAWRAIASAPAAKGESAGARFIKRRHTLLRSAQSPLLHALARVLVGVEWAELKGFIASVAPGPASATADDGFTPRGWLRTHLDALLDPEAAFLHLGGDALAMLKQAGVPDTAAADLWDSFTSPQRGITPLVGGFDTTREPPAELLADWRDAIATQFS